MVSASKLVDRMPQLPDIQLPDIQLPDLPVDVDDVADRLRDITGAATNVARQAATNVARQAGVRRGRRSRRVSPAALVALVVVALGACFLVRSRRSSSDSEI